MDSIELNTDDTPEVPPPQSEPVLDTRRVRIHPDHWYPVAWSRELKAGKPLAVRFAGDPVVLVRPKEGAVFALENRCAHRQVPLDAGVVSGCAIRCGYHGWTYDASGKCIDVPYLGKGKLPNGVKSYPCREVAGLVFIFPGDPALAERFSRSLGGLRKRLQDPPLRPRGQLPLLVHAREPDGHEPSVPAPQTDGADPPALSRPAPRRGLAGGASTHSRAPGGSSRWARPLCSGGSGPRRSMTRTS